MTAKLFILIALIGIAQMAATANLPQVSTKSLFAADLFKQISKTKIDENVVFSPISIQIALAMTYLGAEGETAKELEKGARLPSSDKISVAKTFAQVLKENKGEAQLDIANKIFVSSAYKLAPAYNKLAQEYFQSQAEGVNFSDSPKAIKIVNDWVEQKTNKKITDILKPGSVDQFTSVLIVNAIYFKGNWSSPFNKDSTVKKEFWVTKTKSVDVDTMNDEGYFNFADFADLDASAIEIPYKDSEISMMVILPNQRDGLAKLEEKLSTVAINDLSSKMKEENLILDMPKFKIEFSLPLVDILKNMGMQTMFDERANLSSLLEAAPSIKVSDVQHKAFIDVNEAGSEAAAATVLKAVNFSFNPNMKRFVADHPFVFAIKSPETIYFMGHVSNF